MSPYVIKQSGEKEPWNPAKLERSLYAAGADKPLVDEIVRHVAVDVRDGMRTKDIYRHAFTLLRKHRRPLAAQYSLKHALAEFGPSGFPFERFVAKILEASGYTTEVGVTLPGVCVRHETDVIAENEDERIIVEAKFHNSPEIRSDVKVALYVKARFDDIARRFEEREGENGKFHRAWLITNTNFTGAAIQYGTCAGLMMTGWNYPRGRTLQDLVRETETHPLTVLTTLSNAQKVRLLTENKVLCKDVIDDPAVLASIGVPRDRAKSVIAEAAGLCHTAAVSN